MAPRFVPHRSHLTGAPSEQAGADVPPSLPPSSPPSIMHPCLCCCCVGSETSYHRSRADPQIDKLQDFFSFFWSWNRASVDVCAMFCSVLLCFFSFFLEKPVVIRTCDKTQTKREKSQTKPNKTGQEDPSATSLSFSANSVLELRLRRSNLETSGRN